MTTGLRICIELAVFSFIGLWATINLNKPYPWNSKVLDNIEGLCVLIFLPTFLYSLGRGVWML
jgi:hypothetical protein